MSKTKWFEAKAGDVEGVLKVTIDGEIGWDWWDGSGITSQAFMNAINAMGDVSEIHLDMNSPGGVVTDGLTIANFLREHTAKVICNVLGQASSIASVITSACDEVHMGLGSFMFLHKASSCMCGNTDQMQALANDLATIDEGMLEAYVAKVGEENREAIQGLIEGSDGNGTLISAQEAVELGLADTMLEARAVASFTTSTRALFEALHRAEAEAVAHAREDGDSGPTTASEALAKGFGLSVEEVEAQAGELAERIAALREAVPAELESTDVTMEFLQENYPAVVEQIKAQVDLAIAKKEATDGERERITKMLKVCKTTGNYSQLEKLVSEDWEADKATDYLLATADGEHIDGTLSPEGGQVVAIDTRKVYERRNRKNSQ